MERLERQGSLRAIVKNFTEPAQCFNTQTKARKGLLFPERPL